MTRRVQRWHPGVGDALEPEQFEHQPGRNQCGILAPGIRPQILVGACHIDRPWRDQRDQRDQFVLIDGQLLLALSIRLEAFAEPVGE